MNPKLLQGAPFRHYKEWEAGKDMPTNFADNGDKAKLLRVLDVSLRGTDESLEEVAEGVSQSGFVELNQEVGEDYKPYFFFEIHQAVGEAQIRGLMTK